MAKKINLLIDTDIFIDYFNHQLFRDFFESGRYQIHYSAVTKKELLAKEGLSNNEEKEIQHFLKKCRVVPLNKTIVEKYSQLRKKYAQSEKEDCLVAATALIKKLPLLTQNEKHCRCFEELYLYPKS